VIKPLQKANGAVLSDTMIEYLLIFLVTACISWVGMADCTTSPVSLSSAAVHCRDYLEPYLAIRKLYGRNF
jgi:hypothetical protein